MNFLHVQTFYVSVSKDDSIQFQTYKLCLKKAEELEIHCQHPLDHRKSKRNPEKNIYFCLSDYKEAFDYVEHKKLWKIL